MVLGARLRTVMSPIIRWRKAEILPAGGTEYAEGLLLLMRATVMENPVERHVGDSGNQVGVTTRRSWQPNATRRVSTLPNNGDETDLTDACFGGGRKGLRMAQIEVAGARQRV